jgi:signal recognition particle subunit SRP54
MFDLLARAFSAVVGRCSTSKPSSGDLTTILDGVYDALLNADVPHDVAKAFMGVVSHDITQLTPAKGIVFKDQVQKLMYDKVLGFLGGKQPAFSFDAPATLMVMGLQGSGKTTTVAKLASFILQEAERCAKPRRVLVASIDFYRPAAIEQLAYVAEQAGCSFFKSAKKEPIGAIAEIQDYYRKNAFDLLILDTAGRLHTDDALLGELRAIDVILRPKYKILVLDSMTGQESFAVAKAFESVVGFGYAILTKMDSDTKGGAAFAFRYALNKPIIFTGSGEKVADLELFHPDRVAGRLLDIGDLETLLEKTRCVVDENKQEQVYDSLMKGTFNFHDFAEQCDIMKKIGSFAQVASYLPGLGSKMSTQEFDKGERALRKFRAIINSMTPRERTQPALLHRSESRKKRIAKGAGVGIEDVHFLLKRFEEAKQFAKMIKNTDSLKKMFGL